jgi:hypothetical protein
LQDPVFRDPVTFEDLEYRELHRESYQPARPRPRTPQKVLGLASPKTPVSAKSSSKKTTPQKLKGITKKELKPKYKTGRLNITAMETIIEPKVTRPRFINNRGTNRARHPLATSSVPYDYSVRRVKNINREGTVITRFDPDRDVPERVGDVIWEDNLYRRKVRKSFELQLAKEKKEKEGK